MNSTEKHLLSYVIAELKKVIDTDVDCVADVVDRLELLYRLLDSFNTYDYDKIIKAFGGVENA